jgi:hypothetical protein
MSDIDFNIDVDFEDIDDESWLSDKEELEKNDRLTKYLIPKTLLYDYFKTKTKELHGSRFNITKEGMKTLTRLTNNFVKSYLDQLSEYVIELVLMSNLKTAFPRHIEFSHNVIALVCPQITRPNTSKFDQKRIASKKGDENSK